jgi:RNA polymerase subunit RPABC4/transcription elongation factor Spt4
MPWMNKEKRREWNLKNKKVNIKHCLFCHNIFEYKGGSNSYCPNCIKKYGSAKACLLVRTAKQRSEYAKKYNSKPKIKYARYKKQSKRDKKIFNLTYQQFYKIVTSKCHYCGSDDNIGIDRKNNKIGYIINNSVSACWKCNALKGSKTYEEFLIQIKLIYENLSYKNKLVI